jgi:lipopolysaccharide transport protein LptA
MYNPPIRQTVSRALTLSLLLFSSGSFSLESDRDEAVAWNAEGNVTTRLESGLRILEMSDNVKVTQGTLEILGDQARFEYDAESNQLLRVTVQGNPVNYQQQLDEDGKLVSGSSASVLLHREGDSQETILEFTGNASIVSPDTEMHCAAIVYLADSNLIREATGPCQGSLTPNSN